MADREPDDLLGALPTTRPQRRTARRERTTGGNRPKAAPGTPRGRASAADAAGAEPVGEHAERSGPAPDAARSRHKAAPRTTKPPEGEAAGSGTRRTTKRREGAAAAGAPAGAGQSAAGEGPAVPPSGWSTPRASDRRPPDLAGMALQAAGELAQLGAAVSVSAVRGVLRRLPRP